MKMRRSGSFSMEVATLMCAIKMTNGFAFMCLKATLLSWYGSNNFVKYYDCIQFHVLFYLLLLLILILILYSHLSFVSFARSSLPASIIGSPPTRRCSATRCASSRMNPCGPRTIASSLPLVGIMQRGMI